ncbi:group I intron-associated PD-(D/E)XK endonuclease [Verrucosispora sp. WMMC514]|uniref:group I intron-associated PD-(D/E)XK endonuclease n=1 Tax=Verrucosispora sp. WMMC514 TaxID=3015156 RepID=UPI00248C04E5|nr:group I intron-associated PD-(D/E)XK endonuclease [Verrucosispora sp. WMMC514]WBB94109.1 group I intron-associated PD-(D/E)XK endonuclease [Verrucosispora sp. WMMC514]
MPNPRRYTDDQLREAVRTATCWADVMEGVGKRRTANQAPVRAVVARLGLDVSHFGYARSNVPVQARSLPFSQAVDRCGRSGLSVAATWFLDRGYNVSIPVEPAPYDLVCESDDGLKKVQIKTTRKVSGGGRYVVQLTRTIYNPAAMPNSAGKYRQARYEPGTVDLFFIIAGPNTYLIPYDAVATSTTLNLDDKYGAFVV